MQITLNKIISICLREGKNQLLLNNSQYRWMNDLRFYVLFNSTSVITPFWTVFQSYQDDGQVIMQVYVQWNSVYGWESFASSGLELWTARSAGQRLTHGSTGAPSTLCNTCYSFTNNSKFPELELFVKKEIITYNTIDIIPAQQAGINSKIAIWNSDMFKIEISQTFFFSDQSFIFLI